MAPDPHRNPLRRAAACASLGLLAVLALSQGAAAQSLLYVCTVNGHTISSQLLPQECKNVDVRVLNPDGSQNRVIPAPLTPEQRKKKKEEDEQRLNEEEAERKQRSRDKALMETYSSVDEIEGARKRALQGQQTLIDRADARIAQYTRERKHLDDEAEFYEKRAKPRALQDALNTNQTLMDQQEKTKADVLAEIHALQARYEAQIKRYRELEKMAEEAAALRARETSATQPRDDN